MDSSFLRQALLAFTPCCEQEERDKSTLLQALKAQDALPRDIFPDVFTRNNLTMHFTASSWITDPSRTRILMAYHRIYDAWAWTGGHADGETDLLSVAVREAKEETGADTVPVSDGIFSVEVLTVDGHEKRGVYVPSHPHLNVIYLLEADPAAPIRVKADENSAVRWFDKAEALKECREKWMVERIYSKLNDRLIALS